MENKAFQSGYGKKSFSKLLLGGNDHDGLSSCIAMMVCLPVLQIDYCTWKIYMAY